MTIKGYLVRGTHETRGEIAAWSSDGSIGPRPGASLFRSLDDAAGARGSVAHRGCTDVRIFAVAEDGCETEVPSYAEALAEVERLRAQLAVMNAQGQGDHAEIQAMRAEYTEVLVALKKLFTAARAVIRENRPISGRRGPDLQRSVSTSAILALDEAGEEVRHLAEDDRAEHACPDCGEDARGANHEGME